MQTRAIRRQRAAVRWSMCMLAWKSATVVLHKFYAYNYMRICNTAIASPCADRIQNMDNYENMIPITTHATATTTKNNQGVLIITTCVAVRRDSRRVRNVFSLVEQARSRVPAHARTPYNNQHIGYCNHTAESNAVHLNTGVGAWKTRVMWYVVLY